MLITEVDPDRADEPCFGLEAFCGVCATTSLQAASVPQFVRTAVDFANDRLWGTLNATIIVHPRSLRVPDIALAVEGATARLRYGTVSFNAWAAAGYALVITPWGAYPGHDLYNLQSGTGVVHNTLMFGRVEKSVIRAPFRTWPKPVWFCTHRGALRAAERLARFEAEPSLWKIPGMLREALRS